jgi:hypothetical protein
MANEHHHGNSGRSGPPDRQPYNPSDHEWDPIKAVESMAAEREVLNLDFDKQTEDLLRENGPIAAQVIAHTMQHSTNEKLRFEAAKYVTERVLGKVEGSGLKPKGNDPFQELIDASVTKLEHHANEGDT